jgi:hypothetical protein
MAHKLAALIVLCGMMLSLALARAQENAPYHISNCPTPGTCCVVPAPQMTEPVPGGTPTVVPQAAVNLYGAHFTNLNGSAAYVQFYNTITQPAAGSVPFGAASWIVSADQDRDLSVGELRGMSFTVGIEACCSSTQGTFTALGNCGFLLQYY